MSKNRYVINTTLEGFVNVYKPSGKFNNCSFSFRMSDKEIEQAEKDREELLTWAKSKVDNPKRMNINRSKWDEEGLVSYSYLGDTKRVEPVFIDSEGDLIDKEVLKTLRAGTKVKLIVQQTPYTKPALGTTLKVHGIQVIKLATGNGAGDSGSLSVDDVKDLFGTTEGYKQSSPAVVQEPTDNAPCSVEENYDF